MSGIVQDNNDVMDTQNYVTTGTAATSINSHAQVLLPGYCNWTGIMSRKQMRNEKQVQAESIDYFYMPKFNGKFQKYFRIAFLQLKEQDLQICDQKISGYVSPLI